MIQLSKTIDSTDTAFLCISVDSHFSCIANDWLGRQQRHENNYYPCEIDYLTKQVYLELSNDQI